MWLCFRKNIVQNNNIDEEERKKSIYDIENIAYVLLSLFRTVFNCKNINNGNVMVSVIIILVSS